MSKTQDNGGTAVSDRCPNECRIISLDGEDDFDAEAGGFRVLTGSKPLRGGTLEAWSTCPTCGGTGQKANA